MTQNTLVLQVILSTVHTLIISRSDDTVKCNYYNASDSRHFLHLLELQLVIIEVAVSIPAILVS